MKAINSSIVTTAIALILSGCASAPHSTPQEPVAVLDIPSDAAWASLDPDANGFLTVSGLQARRAMALLQDFDAVDRNGDGRISRSEWDAWWPLLSHTPPSPTMRHLITTDDAIKSEAGS